MKLIRMFLKPALVRYLAVVSVVLLLVSLVGVFATRAIPAEVKQTTVLVNYEHNSQFDYLVTLKPSYLFGPEPQPAPPAPPAPPPLTNPQFPAGIIDRFNFSFAYELVPDRLLGAVTEKVKVTANAKGASGKFEEITLVPETTKAGPFFDLSFPLVIDQYNSTGDITLNIYVYPVVTTDQGLLYDSFFQQLNIALKGPLFEVDRNLQQSELRNSGTLIYEQKGKLAYTVVLTGQNPLGPITLVPPQALEAPAPKPNPAPPPRTIGPGEVIFPRLVDNITASFAYELKADQPVQNRSQRVQITATLEAPKVWSKTLVLVPASERKGDFTINFPIDLNQLVKTLEDIRTETGATATSYTLTIKADVLTVGQTNFGLINEEYSQTLSTDLGGTLEWKEKLEQTKTGSIETTKTIPNPNKYLGLSVSLAKTLSAVLAVIFFLLCAFSVVMYLRFRPEKRSFVEQEAQQIIKKYGQRIVEATNQAPMESREIMSVLSLEDLMKIADELGKPVFHQEPGAVGENHTYFVFDGITRYQFVLAIKS